MSGNEQPKVARDMLVQGAAPGRWVINPDITRAAASDIRVNSPSRLLGVLNGNVSTTIISKKNDDNLQEK